MRGSRMILPRQWITAALLLSAASVSLADSGAKPPRDKAAAPKATAAHTRPEGSAAGFSISGIPAWVVTAHVPAEASVPTAPMHYGLIDEQVHVDANSVSHFTRVIRVVNDAAGLAPASQIEIEFDPTYQTLAIHQLQVLRGQRRIEALDRKRVRLLQRETQLERQIYDGRVTASIVLDDVRAGDRIEYAYTVSGVNPVFDGRYVDAIYAGSLRGPVAFFQLRLLVPQGRAIHASAPDNVESSSRLQSSMRETVFSRRSIPQLQFDLSAPGDQWLSDEIQLSEFDSWADVSRWGDTLFADASHPLASVHQQAESIRNVTAEPIEQLRNALDFVQTQIRYFGTEMGAHSHRPAPPDKVLAQRFGDCKDKVALLIAIVRDLGFEAEPVMVSTQLRDAVSSTLPSPLAFNHAIAVVREGGKTYWLDATRSHQTGDLDGRQASGLGKGLIAGRDTVSLIELPKGSDELRMEVKDLFRAEPISGDPVLESHVTYYGELAETLREALASHPGDEVERQLAAEYVRMFPKIKPDGPPRVQDAAGKDAIEITRRFVVPGYWRFPEQKALVGDFALWSLLEALQRPDDTARKKPFRFPYAGVFRHSVIYEFSEDIATQQSSKHVDETARFFEYHAIEDTDRRSYRVDGELRIPSETVSVQDWQAFREKSGALRPRLAGSLSIGSVSPEQGERVKAAIQQLEEDVRKGKIKVTTVREYKERVRVLVLDAELSGNRLNSEQRGKALLERGEQRDQTGRAAEATSDFDEALRLAPDSAEVYAGAAVNSLLRRRDSMAVWQAAKAIELSPSDNLARFTRAYAEYYQKNYSAARDDFAQILNSRSDVERNYAAIWVYLTDRRSGTTGANAARDPPLGGPASGWPYPILQLLKNTIGVDQAVAATRSAGQSDPEKLCELYFYLGAKNLLDGNSRSARDYFRKSLDTGVVGFNEYAFAQRELDLMNGLTAPLDLSPTNPDRPSQ
jgi:lipoprotein NlpI/transglutaminase-like putative cysteine protease